MAYYFYALTYYNGLDKTEEHAMGITCGQCLTDAMQNLVATYGENDIIDITSLKAITDLNCLEINDPEVAEYLSEIEVF
jgi:hypothetical protein